MEEYKTIFYDKIQELVTERLTTYGPVTYAAKWDSLRSYMDLVLQNLKSFTFETFASTSYRQEQLEEKLVIVADKQETQLQYVVSKKYDMGSKIKAILDILKRIP